MQPHFHGFEYLFLIKDVNNALDAEFRNPDDEVKKKYMDLVLEMQDKLDDMKNNIGDARCKSVQQQVSNVNQSLIQLSIRLH